MFKSTIMVIMTLIAANCILVGCRGDRGENGVGVQGATGPSGAAGQNGSNGQSGQNGLDGINGTNGQDATPVTVVPLCPDVSNYGVFVEVGICLNGKLYGVYSANGGFLTLLADGNYTSAAIGSACNLTISGCTVSH